MNQTTDAPSLAAIDLGSNSFHMIVGRLQNNQLQLIDRLREPVRLAEGLTRQRSLEPEVAARALEALRELDRSRVETIHTFCAGLLREFPVEVGAH